MAMDFFAGSKIGQKDDGFKCAKCDKKYPALTINGTAKDLLESADCGADKHTLCICPAARSSERFSVAATFPRGTLWGGIF